jgi:hypothetical protein
MEGRYRKVPPFFWVSLFDFDLLADFLIFNGGVTAMPQHAR